MSELTRSDEKLAKMFRALGDPTRLRIFNFLRAQTQPVALGDLGEARPVRGATVGDICCHVTGVDKITSTISTHLKTLGESGLVVICPQGKYRICSVDRDAVKLLAEHLGNDVQTAACDCSKQGDLMK
jgi:ArsR family transcriptional regulator